MTFRGPTDPEQFRVKHGRFQERFYFDGLPADDTWPAMDPNEEPWPSVSTIKKVSNRDFSPVAARRVAQFAAKNIDTLRMMLAQPGNTGAAIDLMVGANDRGLNEAGQRGTAVHLIMENLAKGIKPSMVNTPESALPYIDACKAFLHDMQPEFLYNEVVAISRSVFYGGTFDCILKINGKTYMVDWKSRKAGGHAAYQEEGYQVAAYAKADYYVIDVNGVACRVPPPELDGGLIVSLCPNPDSYQVYPVDLEKGWIGFQRMRSMWEVAHVPWFKTIGRPVELMPRRYVPTEAQAVVDTMVAAGAAAEVAPGRHLAAVPPPKVDLFALAEAGDLANGDTYAGGDPFADDDPFAGLPTGDAKGSTHPMPHVIIDADPGDWVEVKWTESMKVGGEVRAMEQIGYGWLKEVGRDTPVTFVDDNGNEYHVPWERALSVTTTERPEPVHVVPIANPVEDAVVEPGAVLAPPSAVLDSLTHVHPARTATEGSDDVRSWLRRRLESDVEQLGGQTAVMKYWPTDLRTRPLDKAGKNQFTAEELDDIALALTNLERDMRLTFPEPRPDAPPPQHYEPLAPEELQVALAEAKVRPLAEPEPDPRAALSVVKLPVDLRDLPVGDDVRDAHPDDVAAMVARAVALSRDIPLTWKRIEKAAKDAGVPNLRKGGVKDHHLATLNDLINGFEEALDSRRAEADRLCDGMDAMSQLAVLTYCGSIRGEDSTHEPSEDYLERISLLTEGLKSGTLEFYRAGEDESVALGVAADTVAILRELYPENIKLYRALNTYLIRYGFDGIGRVGELRRVPLAALMLLKANQETLNKEQEHGHVE